MILCFQKPFFTAVDANTTIYTLATCGNDNKIKIWRVYSIAEGRPNRRDSSAGTSSEMRLKSRLVSTTLQQHYAETATIFPTLYLNTECVHSFIAHGSSVTMVKFNSSGTLLISGGFDRLVKIWNLQGNCLKTLGEHQRYVNCVAINVRKIDIEKFISRLTKFNRQVDSTIVASGSNDKSLHIWDLTGSLTKDSHVTNGLKSLLYSLTKNELDVRQIFT